MRSMLMSVCYSRTVMSVFKVERTPNREGGNTRGAVLQLDNTLLAVQVGCIRGETTACSVLTLLALQLHLWRDRDLYGAVTLFRDIINNYVH